jgi:hypothetical protein
VNWEIVTGASEMDASLMMRDDGENLIMMIGADDEAVIWCRERAKSPIMHTRRAKTNAFGGLLGHSP